MTRAEVAALEAERRANQDWLYSARLTSERIRVAQDALADIRDRLLVVIERERREEARAADVAYIRNVAAQEKAKAQRHLRAHVRTVRADLGLEPAVWDQPWQRRLSEAFRGATESLARMRGAMERSQR